MDIVTKNLGTSVEGRALEAKVFQVQNPHWILFLGGVHGDEIEGVWLMEALCKKWGNAYPGKNLTTFIWPQVNPDGVAKNQRCNSRNIDLNRNLPSKDWTPEVKNPRYPPGTSPNSEPENQALVKLINEGKPLAILSAHSFHKYQVNINGPSKEWGTKLSELCGYPVTEDIGYPTPGCLGTYSGKELGIPTITLEIERGLAQEKVLELHMPLMEASLQYWEERIKNESL